jgi:DMSO/TMAO reductase YedYZ molybdopterin-dependent catalytic subunit
VTARSHQIPSRRAGAVAGVVAAGVALAVTEVISALASSTRPSVVSAVASRLVDLTAGTLKNVAVNLFGTNDKAALLTGIVIVSLLVGTALGVAAARHRFVGASGFAVFGLVGILAARADPQASAPALGIASVLGAGAGIVTLEVLLRFAMPRPADTTPARGRAEDPRVKTADRRAFLAAGGVGVVAAVVTLSSRRLRGTNSAARSRAATTLPRPRNAVPAPSTQPFTVDGISPYITRNDDFYRIDTAIFVPQIDAATWKLDINGMVDTPASFTYADLLAMDLVEEPITIACVSNEVGGNLVGNAIWRGVPLKALLGAAGVQPGATQIVGRSVDGFTVGFPTEKALDGRTAMVAVGMNGEPLPIDHGFPTRLIVGGLYGYVSATKWLKQIELTRLEDFDAYWVPRGWAKQAPIKTQSRIDVPRAGATLAAANVAVAGVAWAPTRGIRRVEVQIDDGPWQRARLGDVASDNTWVQWLYQWDATPGSHRLRVRATDGTGAAQAATDHAPAPDGATGYHARRVTIT